MRGRLMAIDEGGCLPPARCARPPEDIWGKMKLW